MLIARDAKGLGIPTLYYFPPGKYRSAPEDVLDAARTITRVAAPLQLSFEKYRALQAEVEFVGHPMLDLLPESPDQERTRAELGVKPGEHVIGLLPGSRTAELEFHTRTLCEAAAELSKRHANLRFLVPMVRYRDPALHERMEQLLHREIAKSGAPIDVICEQATKVMSVARLLLICSGTATLEATFYGAPMVIVYRVSKIAEFLAPLFHDVPFKFVGLPNILADCHIVPELVQDEFTTANVVREASAILSDPEREAKIRSQLAALRPHLGSKGASERVARMVLAMIQQRATSRAPGSAVVVGQTASQ
jgi:lipid-A-disaccharide synthase